MSILRTKRRNLKGGEPGEKERRRKVQGDGKRGKCTGRKRKILLQGKMQKGGITRGLLSQKEKKKHKCAKGMQKREGCLQWKIKHFFSGLGERRDRDFIQRETTSGLVKGLGRKSSYVKKSGASLGETGKEEDEGECHLGGQDKAHKMKEGKGAKGGETTKLGKTLQ